LSSLCTGDIVIDALLFDSQERWELRGKTREDSLLKIAPAAKGPGDKEEE
jgi:hypothetical protein